MTNGSGQYSFPGLANGTYYVIVDSKTLAAPAYNGVFGLGDVWAEQSYAIAGAASGGSFTLTDGALFGGRNATSSDDASALTSAEHVIKVTVSGANVNGVDMGFSMNLVSNTLGGDTTDHDPIANRSVQGSLRQFLQNANAMAGGNDLRFVPAVASNDSAAGGNWWEIVVTSALPAIGDANTTIDGTAYNAAVNGAVRDDNPGLLGAGGTVGVDGLALSQVARPELEIQDGVPGGAVSKGLDIDANNTTIRALAVWGFGDPGLLNGDILIDFAVSSTLIEDNIIGATAWLFADPGAERGRAQGIEVGANLTGPDNGTIRDNLIGFHGYAGIEVRGFGEAATGWLIEGNEIRGNGILDSWWDGINVVYDVSGLVIRGNLISDNQSPAVDIVSNSSATVENNTVTNNSLAAGAEQFGIDVHDPALAGVTIDRNVISGNTGLGVVVHTSVAGSNVNGGLVRVTRNALSGNSGLGIDLDNSVGSPPDGDGVTANDALDGDSGPNNLQNFPLLTSATINGGTVTIDGSLNSSADTPIRLEFFASPAGDASGYGEGQRYLGYQDVLTDGSGNANFSANLTAAVAADEVVSSTATRANAPYTVFYETSEFSANVIAVLSPLKIVYYSVGVSAADLKSGTPTLDILNGTATFSVGQPDNVGVGDEITYNGTSKAYVSGRTSSTVYTVTAATGATPGNVAGATVDSIRRAFNTLTAAEANSSNANHLNTLNLVSGNYLLNWPVYNDGPMNDGGIQVYGYTTGPTNYIRIYTPTAASEVGISQRHTGIAGTGFRLVPSVTAGSGSYQVLYIRDAYVRVEGIEIDGSNIVDGEEIYAVRTNHTDGDVWVQDSIIHDLTNSLLYAANTGDVEAILNEIGNIKVSNSLIYNLDNLSTNPSSNTYGMNFDQAGDTAYVFNNTVFNLKQSGASGGGLVYGIRAVGSTVHARNNYVGDVISAQNLEYAYEGTFSTTTNNVSSDGTASGAGSQTGKNNYAAYFVNTTSGAEDLHLRNDSSALWGSYGADLDGDANLPVTADIDGDSRDASQPDIGVDEFTGAPITRSIYYSVGTSAAALYTGNASASGGTLTLESAAADTIGVGDEIRQGANRYYISGRLSSTVFNIQNSAANGGTPGATSITFTSTAITIYRAFNTLTAAEANSSNASHLNTLDLVSGNYQLDWPVYNDGPMNDGGIQVYGYTTGPTNYIRIYTPTAASEVGVAQRHTGVAGTGFRLVPTASLSGSNSYDILRTEDAYVRVEGIELDGSNVSNGDEVWGVRTTHIDGDVQIRSLIIHDLTNSTVDDIDQSRVAGIYNQTGNVKVSNTIVYDITDLSTHPSSRAYGMHFDEAGATAYVFNNTIYDIKQSAASGGGDAYGLRAGLSTVHARNNYVGDVISTAQAEHDYDGTFSTTTNNVSSDSTASGAGSQTGKSNYAAYFVNTTPGAEDLHLRNDSNALWGSYGADLDNDPDLPVTADIDGDARDASLPDIGADEFAGSPVTRAVYYSVGTSAADLKSGTPTVMIWSGTATFSVAQPDNVGVGDQITYAGSTVAYISGRTSSTVYSVITATGATPANVIGGTVNSILRAFNSLSVAEANSSDVSHLGTSDLVAGNFQLNWPTYNDGAMNDTVSISGWTTAAANYIRIFTPTASGQVGVSQRHTGVAGTGFRLVPILDSPPQNTALLQIDEEYVRVEGIEIDGSTVTNARAYKGLQVTPNVSATSDVRIDGNIIHDLHVTHPASDNWHFGIDVSSAVGLGPRASISNNVVYDLTNPFDNFVSHVVGISIGYASASYVYNNTVYHVRNTGSSVGDAAWGIQAINGATVFAKNNYVGDVVSDLDVEGAYDARNGAVLNQEANVSSDATGNIINQSSYASYFANVADGSENLHLLNDSNALWGSYGADLDGDPNLPVTADIDGEARDATEPDIGADEVTSPPFEFNSSSFVKPIGAAPVVQSITGLGFQPKAILFYWTRQETSDVKEDHIRAGYGFASGPSNQRAIGIASDNNMEPNSAANAGRWGSATSSIVILNSSAPGLGSEAVLTSFDPDGFTLTWTTNEAREDIIHYMAVGGPGVTGAFVGTLTKSAGTGNQPVAGLGFQPDSLMLMSINSSMASNTQGKVNLGFASSPTQEASIGVQLDDACFLCRSTHVYQRLDRLFVELSNTGTEETRLDLISFDADGFTFNREVNGNPGTPIFFLALRGGSYAVGDFDRSVLTAPPDVFQSVSGVGFRPTGLILISPSRPRSSVVETEGRVTFGTSDGTNQGSTFWHDDNGASPTIARERNVTTAIVSLEASEQASYFARATLDSFDGDGFTLRWTVSDSSPAAFIYLAIGPAP